MTPEEQTAYDALTPEQQTAFDTAAREKEQAEQATLPYKWTQDLSTVTLTFDVPTGSRARDLAVEIKRTTLKVSSELESATDGSTNEMDPCWNGRAEVELELTVTLLLVDLC